MDATTLHIARCRVAASMKANCFYGESIHLNLGKSWVFWTSGRLEMSWVLGFWRASWVLGDILSSGGILGSGRYLDIGWMNGAAGISCLLCQSMPHGRWVAILGLQSWRVPTLFCNIC